MSLANSLALQSYSYEQLESSMCTGDIILYNDDDRPASLHVSWAEWLTRTLALLPCSTYSIACSPRAGVGASEEEPRCDDTRREWLHWRCAALVVRMIDETETNAQRDPEKFIPYVFFVHGDSQCHNLWPLKTLLREVSLRRNAGSVIMPVYFVLRQLMTSNDGQQANQRLCSQLRNSLRTQILAFYQQTLLEATGETRDHDINALDRRWRAVKTALDDLQPRPVQCYPLPVPNKHRIALYRASPCYFTLCTLYHINVLRIEPCASTSTAALQEGGIIEHQLARDYSLTDEIPFYFVARK